MLKQLKVLVFLFFICIQYTSAQEYPVISDMVTDDGDIFSDSEALFLREKLLIYENNTSHEIVVLTIRGLDGDSIENYAYSVFNQDGNNFGKQGVDNGILLLISPNDRKVRIEVGDGLEHIITDALASRIIRELITPMFKQGRFFEGIDSATSELIKLIDDPIYAKEFSISTKKKNKTTASGDQSNYVTKFFFSLFFTFVYVIIGWYCYCKFVLKKSIWKSDVKWYYKKYKPSFWLCYFILVCIIFDFLKFFVLFFTGLFFVGFLSVFVYIGFAIILQMAIERATLIFKALFTGKLGLFNFWFYFPFTLLFLFGGFVFGFVPFFMGIMFIAPLIFKKDINDMMSNIPWEYFLTFMILIFMSFFVIAIVSAIKKINKNYKETFGFVIFKRGVGLSNIHGGSSSSRSSRGYSSSGSSSYSSSSSSYSRSSSSSSSSSYSGGGGRSSGGGASGSW
ncbi:TPM domain-containing protein [Psychroserpens sp. NJDZ02]|uniref:TPM domain-containing protein n=1 Tax=Psychroserpens sp. NJDZ02 TaxID=2570561 RepID=UPI0010A761F9|nr:TPM domain-containing protein [Psychroserpens sp. NJDZ02]QCE41184.1 TPM domain-containing protein [Psychroserpens sp. NJDZ02]